MSTPPATVDAFDGAPTVVHVSDVHGYLADARSALRAVGETDAFDPVVTADDDGTLHWADNDHVLVVNGDLIDRGPANEECLALVRRLQREAPPGRVRYHIGNHELAVLLPALVGWRREYSVSLSPEERRAFLERVADGAVTAAFDGYDYTYSHAGRNDPFDVGDVNDALRDAASELLARDGGDERVQRRLASHHAAILGIGDSHGGRGPDAGLCWMDFAHLEASAPPQVVGHTKHARATRNGNVVCGNVIRLNHGSPGGEGVLVETRDDLTAVRRTPSGDVATTTV
ncbi:metallophosphoesterase (plasmid) [Halarchaeum sp. CBA1220]|uniref:metallophosphoesterase n=1 Tax=Halarchaeum sp. CBA1220 TaxID=1853682 RepID=UPI000F3A98BF|nr:metallophosphoesterase [Halarchaeum sp. CBA1220]QLC35313.1 metallophosphoesterase [Halarchaeum sp. CBA1220]